MKHLCHLRDLYGTNLVFFVLVSCIMMIALFFIKLYFNAFFSQSLIRNFTFSLFRGEITLDANIVHLFSDGLNQRDDTL